MKAVVFHVFQTRPLVGSLFNAFEYFVACYEQDKDFKLVLTGAKPEDIDYYMQIFENRYDLSGLENIRNNIIDIERRIKLVQIRFENALVVDYSTIYMTKGLFCPKKLIVISEKYTEDKDYFYRKDWYNVTYYGEMPFHYRDKEYRMKFLFDRFKKLNEVKEGIYISAPQCLDEEYLEEINLPNKPIYFKSRDNHLNNLFEQFDTYVYYHCDRWFDPHPRLMIESYFYGKEILYFNKPNVKDGSFYRYNDLMKRGIEDRSLTKDDEIVKEILS